MAGNGEPETSEALKTFGAVLKALRDKAALTQEDFAPRVRYSTHYVASIEQGRRFPPKDLVERGEEVLDAGGVLRAAAKYLTRRVGLASWFREWAAIEEDAISLYAYACRVVPGMLQPEEYIRAVFDSRVPPLTEDEIEKQVAARLDRQRMLTERPNTSFSFIVEQALFERRTGGGEVTRILIDHLLEVGRLRNVEIQVMPLRQATHAGLNGSLCLAETPDYQWVGYFEGQRGSVLVSGPKEVSVQLQRYGKMRSQALCHQASASLLKQLRGEL
ncbi:MULTISPECIES: helix-turn-helix domain-containing protein [Streptomyces]|uniref:helix-turn-helix domain-containing protein n=1 Tax=Streptomyces TaxID=1883 RepID=UPI0016009BD8|nr:helix-turn-helix transcriptional regulator [Streptomyces murinus]MBA9049221.1 transcriptional regulator with XRE-family HTH domain [Streptomyces murinus]